MSFIVAIDGINARTSQIKRRRKRLPPPEPRLGEPGTCAKTPLDLVLPDEGPPTDLSPVIDGIRGVYPFPGGVSTLEDYTASGESSPVLSQTCSHSVLPIPNHGGQPITVHEFLQDMSAGRRAGRKYGRRNRLATVKLDAHYRSRSPTPITLGPSSCHVETRNDQRISARYYPRIQSKHPSRQVVPHRQRKKKQLAKPLAQRLFEADVFSSGTSSPRPMSDRDPAAHTSSRRPLQFTTSLNMTPSLESRIYPKKGGPHGKARKTTAEIRAPSQADGSALGTSPNGLAAATCSELSSRRWNGAATPTQRTRTGASAAVVASGKRAFRTRGGKRNAAQMPPSPFEYVPLPLVRVETVRGYTNPNNCTGRARTSSGMCHVGVSSQFQLMYSNQQTCQRSAPRI